MKYGKRILMYGIPKSLLFKIILLLVILLLGKNVFAKDYDVSNSITSPVAPSNSGTYTGTELNGASSSWNINTRYQGTLQNIRFNIPKPAGIEGDCFWTNMTYKVTMNMATNDWRNNFGSVKVAYSSSSSNLSSGKVTFVSRQKIYFTFKIPTSDNTCYQHVYVDLPSSELFSVFTGDSNWNLKSVILSDELSSGSSSGSGSGSGSTPTPTPDSSQNIINNQNQNTQDIINNNNSNTSDIIDNANQNFSNLNDNISANSISEINTQRYNITSQCTNSYEFDIFKGKRLTTSGSLVDDPNSFYVPQKIAIGSGVTTIYIHNPLNSVPTYVFLLFDSSGNVLSVTNTATRSISVPSNAVFFQFSSTVANTFIFKNSNCILNSQKQTDDIINNQNSNTDKQINSQYVCKSYDTNYKKTLGYLTSSGSILSHASGSYYISDYIPIYSTSKLKLKIASENALHTCFYSSNFTKISCFGQNSYDIDTEIPIPENASYIRYSMNISTNRPLYSICNNGNQALQDSLTDSNVETSTGSDFFNDFSTSDNGGISGIITKPLVLINSLLSSNDSCQDLSFTITFPGLESKSVSFPSGCVLWNNVPTTVINIYQMFVVAFCSYYLLRRLFNDVENLKNPDNDSVEVIDL